MTQKIYIAPSILSADFANLGQEITQVVNAGADWIHFDVMDNHYVPNLTLGPMVCQAIKPYCQNSTGQAVPIDAHLMVKPVDKLAAEFAAAGADYITFHPEASEHPHRTVQLIKQAGAKAGLAFNPATPLDILDWLIDDIDMILIMSVNPGFGGQGFIPTVMPKIAAARRRIAAANKNIRLEVDGGIKIDNIAAVAAAGADTFVAGSAIFNSANYQQTISLMRQQLGN